MIYFYMQMYSTWSKEIFEIDSEEFFLDRNEKSNDHFSKIWKANFSVLFKMVLCNSLIILSSRVLHYNVMIAIIMHYNWKQ